MKTILTAIVIIVAVPALIVIALLWLTIEGVQKLALLILILTFLCIVDPLNNYINIMDKFKQ